MNLSVCIPAQTISSVDVKAETGGTVMSPVLTGNTFTAPLTVTIISTTAGHGTVTVTLLTETQLISSQCNNAE